LSLEEEERIEMETPKVVEEQDEEAEDAVTEETRAAELGGADAKDFSCKSLRGPGCPSGEREVRSPHKCRSMRE